MHACGAVWRALTRWRASLLLQSRSLFTPASPMAPMAVWNQLCSDAIAGLLHSDRGVGVVPSFAGAGWPALYAADADRLHRSGRMTQQTHTVASAGTVTALPTHSVVWLEPAECDSEYPALSDLLQRLHALPFELNSKADLRLSVALPSSTQLRRYEHGGRAMPVVDCGAVGTDRDVGFKVTATYYFAAGETSSSSSSLSSRSPVAAACSPDCASGGECDSCSDAAMVLRHQAPSSTRATTRIPVVSDTLVLHRSRALEHRVGVQRRDGGTYALIFFMHGQDDRF